MAHKVHPGAFRIRETSDWRSRGFYLKNLPSFLEEDFLIRKFIKEKIGRVGIESVEVERYPGKINIIIFTSRPGLIIGRGGEAIEKLKEELKKHILKKQKSLKKSNWEKSELRIEIKEVKNPWTSASLVSQWMASQIERRIPFRRVLKQALEKIRSQKGVLGARVQVAGRLNGVEISRREWLSDGRLPRQTIRADIDFAKSEAFCTYGTIGIKVWIYKGEKNK